MFGRITDKAAQESLYLLEQTLRIGFAAELGIHPVVKLASAFFLGHGLNLSAGSRCVARFPPWRPHRSVRVVLQLPDLSMRRGRVRGRRASPLQWWVEALDEHY